MRRRFHFSKLAVGRGSIARRLQVVLVSIVLPVVIGVVTTGYLITSRMLTDRVQESRETIEQGVAETLRLAERGVELVSTLLEQVERPALERFDDAYIASGSVDDLDLGEIRDGLRAEIPDRFAERIDLYVIDAAGVVVATTYQSDLGLDFSLYPSFYNALSMLFDEGGYRSDNLRPEIVTGTVRRFSYMRSSDGKYILEIGLTLPVLSDAVSEFSDSANAMVAEGWGLVVDVRVFSPDGVVIRSELDPAVGTPATPGNVDVHDTVVDHAQMVRQVLQRGETVRMSSQDGNTLYSFVPVRIERATSLESQDRVVEVAFDLTQTRTMLRNLLIGYISGAAGFVLLALVLGLRLVHRLTEPIVAITEEIAAIGAGNLDRRITAKASGEVGVLKESVNAMVEQLVASQRALERTVDERNESLRHVDGLSRIGRIAAAVAHDLSTPLSVALQALTYQASEIREKRHLLEDPKSKAASQMMENLLESSTVGARSLARAAGVLRSFKRLALGRPQGDETTFDVVEVIKDVAVTLEVIARRAGIGINVSQHDEDISLRGVEGAFAQLMANLIENAIRHAYPSDWSPPEPGATKTISIGVSADNDTTTVVVEDNGVGIPDEIREDVFKPFYTTKPDEGGTGLGLAIAHDVAVNVLGGEIEVGRADGGGARFTIRLPRLEVRPLPPAEAT